MWNRVAKGEYVQILHVFQLPHAVLDLCRVNVDAVVDHHGVCATVKDQLTFGRDTSEVTGYEPAVPEASAGGNRIVQVAGNEAGRLNLNHADLTGLKHVAPG